MKRKRCREWAGRTALTAVLVVSLLAGTDMSVSAGRFVRDPATLYMKYQEDDGSYAVDKWVKSRDYENWNRWVYVGPEGYVITEECAAPCPVIPCGDGSYMVDQRIRSITGMEGQQPEASAPSKQKDIRYKGLRKKLDAIPLYPDATTGSAELDAVLDQIFAQIITPDMDTHDKLKACYDYLIITKFDPRYEEGEVPSAVAVPVEDVYSVYYDAASLLYSGAGVCDNFSAAFAVMAWKIGVPVYAVQGYVGEAGSEHTWCQLDLADGTTYIFDPHSDYRTALRSGYKISYNRFGASSAKVAGKYYGIYRIFDKVK